MSEREKLIDILVMSPMSDSVGPLMSPVERTATQILDSEWLATVKADAFDEGVDAQRLVSPAWEADRPVSPYRGEQDRPHYEIAVWGCDCSGCFGEFPKVRLVRGEQGITCPWDGKNHDFSARANYPEKQGWVNVCTHCGLIEGEQA
jgi:hypothetical protein